MDYTLEMVLPSEFYMDPTRPKANRQKMACPRCRGNDIAFGVQMGERCVIVYGCCKCRFRWW